MTCCVADGAGYEGSVLIAQVLAAVLAACLIYYFFSKFFVYFILGNQAKLKPKPICLKNHENREIWKMYTNKQITYNHIIPI
jgi:hypothetical protein